MMFDDVPAALPAWEPAVIIHTFTGEQVAVLKILLIFALVGLVAIALRDLASRTKQP